jgi:hypothetical protein
MVIFEQIHPWWRFLDTASLERSFPDQASSHLLNPGRNGA